MNNKKLCPCGSKKHYEECCGKYHAGLLPENALNLMRSRFSAYALGLHDYIIKTTHPDNPSYTFQFESWKKDILQFCQNTSFEGLKIIEFTDGENSATVTFKAYLKQSGKDVSFTEKSSFVKVGSQWLYKDGVV